MISERPRLADPGKETILMLIRREQVEALSRFPTGEHLITSCYLNTDGRHQTQTDPQIVLKGMVREAREGLEASPLPSPVRAAALEDLERLRSWFDSGFERKGARGVAVFACSSKGLWEVFPVPRPLPSRLVQDHTPYVRPLTVLLDEHPRFCAVLVDREQARIFEVYLGEIEEYTEFTDEVPPQVRAGGPGRMGPGGAWQGYPEKRISRHIEDHVHRHYKKAAERAFEVFRRQRFDWLVVGGHREALNDFVRFLHSYLQERLKATIEMSLAASPDQVLEKVRSVEQDLEREREADLLKRLETEAHKNGAAVLGTEKTLEALHRGAVHTLVVDNDEQASGWKCRECGRMTLHSDSCPSCREASLVAVPHLIDDAIEETVLLGGQVEHVFAAAGFKGKGPLAAILRFRLPG